MDISYKLMSIKEADLAIHGQEYVDNMAECNFGRFYEDDFWYRKLVRCEDGNPVEIIGEDGGEPEDQCFRRDWQWVPQALQDAYQLGRDHGYSDGYEDSHFDAVDEAEHRTVD